MKPGRVEPLAIGVVGAGPMLGDPLTADDAQIMPFRPAGPKEAHHNSDEEYAAGYEPPGVHGDERV